MSWLGDSRTTMAAERILDAAAELFISEGVAAVDMKQIASAAGCSRATLYRYFENRETLHIAYVNREARAITAQVSAAVEGIADPAERLITAMLTAVQLVRGNPALAAWFRPGEYIGGSLGLHSEVINAMVSAFITVDDTDEHAALRARWYVRVIISMLSYPEDDPGDERRMLTEFVVPVMLEGGMPTPAAAPPPGG